MTLSWWILRWIATLYRISCDCHGPSKDAELHKGMIADACAISNALSAALSERQAGLAVQVLLPCSQAYRRLDCYSLLQAAPARRGGACCEG